LKPRLLTAIGLAGSVAVGCAVLSSAAFADGENKSKNTKKDEAAEKPAKAASAEQQKLTGQQLYAINCNRCHSERYATEFTVAHWRTIMMHMRVRANLPADQAKEILKYLEQDAGN